MPYKCALVPEQYFDAVEARAILIETVDVDPQEQVNHIDIPFYKAVLIYAGEQLPELYHLLLATQNVPVHNKIIASYDGQRHHLVIAQGSKLMLCNSFKAIDFTSAEYFIFLALKKFSLNPEISTIYFRSPLDKEQQMSLYRYFKDVEQL